MRASGKLSGEERRASIIQAVRHLFASKGFKGTTTRELADAAGVSEALLYKHFPTKEALFEAIQQSLCDDQSRAQFERISALAPSTKTLVLLVQFLVSKTIGNQADEVVRGPMIIRSLVEDGDFARMMLQPFQSIFIPKIEECLHAAASAGDAECSPVLPSLGAWFAYDLAAMVSLQSMATPAVVEFGLSRDRLVGQLVWFALRGLGLKEKAIRRHYDPEAPFSL